MIQVGSLHCPAPVRPLSPSESPESRAPAVPDELTRYRLQIEGLCGLAEALPRQRDADGLNAVLARHVGKAVAADGMYLESAGTWQPLETVEDAGDGERLPLDHLEQALAGHCAAARQARRVLVPELAPGERELLAEHCVLLAPLPVAGRPGTLVVLRRAGRAAFDDQDVRIVSALLTYAAPALRTADMAARLQRTVMQTVSALVNAIDAKDNYTSSHSARVAELARLTARELGLPLRDQQAAEWAGLLHDIGKIGVPEQILNKPGLLTPSETSAMQRHTVIGHEMLRPVAQFAPVLDAVLHHHENPDGSGYPHGLRGEEIPLRARIIHVADIFDALTTNRPYRRAYDCETALEMLRLDAGRITDAAVTAAFELAFRRYRVREHESFVLRFAHLLEPGLAAAGRGVGS